MPNLGLNEALLVINKGNITRPLGVLYQNQECFGCLLTPLKPIADEPDKYVIDTKYNAQLELQANAFQNLTAESCRFDDLAINSGGQYRIDVESSSSRVGQLECTIKTLDYGECLLCPFAILICFLFALTASEQVYKKFWLDRQPRRRSEADAGLDARDLKNMRPSESNASVATPGGPSHEEQPSSSNGKSASDQTALATTSKTFATLNPAGSLSLEGSKPGQRVECLDIFRGLTLAGMIFVNYGGAGYAVWDHKPWDGITLADFVFPFFVFSMGASIAITCRSLVKRDTFKAIFVKIFTRSVILFMLGLFLNSKAVNYEQPDGLSRLRLTGVLQRFAVSYFAVAFMYTIELTLNRWIRAQSLSNVPYLSKFIGVIFEVLTAINYIAIYIYITFFFEYDSSGRCPAGYVGPGGQTAGSQWASCTGGSAAWLDRLILGENHLYNDHEVKQIFKTQVSHDPEGILGYTTSIVLTLIGLQVGKILIGKQAPRQKLITLAKWILALSLSSSLVLVIPINKRLWSLTFVLVTALAACVLILAFYVLIDIYACRKIFLVRLLSSAGKNSIFLYVGHSLVYGLLPWWFPLTDATSHMQHLFRLTWATLIWLLAAHYMAHKKLFIRV